MDPSPKRLMKETKVLRRTTKHRHIGLSRRKEFATRLLAAIDQQGLTYEEAARLVQAYLPPGLQLSSVSLWQYAHGKAFPRRTNYIEAISRAFNINLNISADIASPDFDGMDRSAGPEDRQINLEDLGQGRVRLYIGAIISWRLAAKIISLFMAKVNNLD